MADRSADALLERLFARDVLCAAAPIADYLDALRPSERAAIADASAPHRRAEFSTGRWLARGLLAKAGVVDATIDRGSDRAPIWPAGFVGSISHSGELCAVAVARAQDCVGLGLDLEPDLPLRAGLERLICFDDELAWIADADGEGERLRRCRMVFSAKEAVYKAFYPRARRVWRFAEVALELDLARGVFRARLPADAGRAEIMGRIAFADGWMASGVAITPPAPAG